MMSEQQFTEKIVHNIIVRLEGGEPDQLDNMNGQAEIANRLYAWLQGYTKPSGPSTYDVEFNEVNGYPRLITYMELKCGFITLWMRCDPLSNRYIAEDRGPTHSFTTKQAAIKYYKDVLLERIEQLDNL